MCKMLLIAVLLAFSICCPLTLAALGNRLTRLEGAPALSLLQYCISDLFLTNATTVSVTYQGYFHAS